MNMDCETLEWIRCVKKYRGPKIEHPSTHRTVLNGSVLFVKVVLFHVCLWKGDFLSWGTANVLTQVLQIHDLTKIKGEIKLGLHILSWMAIQIGGKHAALLVPSPLHLRMITGTAVPANTCGVHTFMYSNTCASFSILTNAWVLGGFRKTCSEHAHTSWTISGQIKFRLENSKQKKWLAEMS